MPTGKKYVDADGHVIERDGEELYDFLEGSFTQVNRVTGLLPSLDRFHTPSSEALRRKPGTFQATNAERWLEFLDKTDIEWTVLYPTVGLAYGRVAYPEWAVAYAKAYNNWVHERFMKASPRLKAVALIPMQDVPSAVEEMRRAIRELGMAGVMIPSNGLHSHISAKQFWPIYEEAERLDCAVAVHGGSYENLGFNTFTVFPATRALGMPIPLMIALTGLMVDGVLDAFPKLRVGFLEGGSAWVPTVIDRLRREVEYAGLPLGKDPEEYFREGRLFVGCEGNEEALGYTVQRIGYQSLVFATDFPHEVTMENASEEIDEILERQDLAEEHKMAILGENARRFYKTP